MLTMKIVRLAVSENWRSRIWPDSSLISITAMNVLPAPVPRFTIVFSHNAASSSSSWYGRAVIASEEVDFFLLSPPLLRPTVSSPEERAVLFVDIPRELPTAHTAGGLKTLDANDGTLPGGLASAPNALG